MVVVTGTNLEII